MPSTSRKEEAGEGEAGHHHQQMCDDLTHSHTHTHVGWLVRDVCFIVIYLPVPMTGATTANDVPSALCCAGCFRRLLVRSFVRSFVRSLFNQLDSHSSLVARDDLDDSADFLHHSVQRIAVHRSAAVGDDHQPTISERFRIAARYVPSINPGGRQHAKRRR